MSTRILVAGAGVFGTHLAREILRRTDAVVVLAARRLERVNAVADALASNRVEPMALDLSDVETLREAAIGCAVVACTAGPFDALDRGLPRAAAEAGAHWVDIADEPAWISDVMKDEATASAAFASSVGVMPGRSTLPALSCALVRWCASRVPEAYRASITLTIGNKNPKGAAAIAAAVAGGFRNPTPVETPLGRLFAWHFSAPEPALLGPSIHPDVRVALEWSPAAWLVASANRLPRGWRSRFARTAATLASVVAPFGTEGGAVQAEVFDPFGAGASAALVFPQRVAVAPAAYAIEAILSGRGPASGIVSPVEWPSAAEAIDDAIASGARFLVPRA